MAGDFATGRAVVGSTMSRLQRLAQTRFDLAVMGAGATGAAIARDAALRGLSVLLLDRGDVAGGTSSGSSRMIHGGLRYLLSGQVDLVKECLRERSILLRLAPHLVRRAPFVITSYRSVLREQWPVRVGLSIVRRLSSEPEVENIAIVRRDRLLQLLPFLERQGLRGGVEFSDGVAHDARLVLEVALGAQQAGAQVETQIEVLEVRRQGGRAVGLRLRDRLNGEEGDIDCRSIVEALGAWAGSVDIGARGQAPSVAAARGTHLALPEILPHDFAVAALHPRDKRYVWAVGLEGHTWVGTTDEEHRGPADAVAPTAEEVAYLQEWVATLFPGEGRAPFLARAALRPLVLETGRSRDFKVGASEAGVLAVLGGKLTTARAMAEVAVDKLLTRPPFFELSPRVAATAHVPLPGAPPLPMEDWLDEGKDLPVAAATRRHLLRRYGRRGPALLARIAADPSLGRPLHELRPEVAVEVDHAAEAELARSLSDVMWRRTFLAFTPDQGEAAVPAVVERLTRKLGWNRDEQQRQIDRYLAEVEIAVAPIRAAAALRAPAPAGAGR
jgi:glycerol-3-phosphate dehydrogenase